MDVPEGALRSDDGRYWWDGSEWQLVPDENVSAGNGSAGNGANLAEAMAAQGIPLAGDAADAGYIQQVAQHVSSWYDGLDDTSRTIVDALSQQGADQLLADPEVGVVAEGDPLITAFAQNDMTLHQSLQATNQALEQTA
jgi:hypothetical protein